MNRGPTQKFSQGLPMSRRTLIRLLAGLLVAAPRMAKAQGLTIVRRIGFLTNGAPETAEEIQEDGGALRELGWVEGKNLRVERRYSNYRTETLQSLAEELVRAKVEVIVTGGTSGTLAAKHATTTIPIVFGAVSDPVLLGLVRNLARPGGNITGYSVGSADLFAKRLTILKELLPALRRVGVFAPAGIDYYRAVREQEKLTCRSLGLESDFIDIASAQEIDAVLAKLAARNAQALLLRSTSFTAQNASEIASSALKHGLPLMGGEPRIARELGVLISYSATQAEQVRRTASYVDRILRGAKPADLPVEQPTRWELVINMKTAQALGVPIPRSLLLRADEVVQ